MKISAEDDRNNALAVARDSHKTLELLENSDGVFTHDTLGRSIRMPVIIGFVTFTAFFGGLGLWSFLAPLASAVIASGQVTPEGATRTVQHLEGGIIGKILVQAGQRVQAGEPLVQLEDVKARTRLNELIFKDVALSVRRSRLMAESAGKTKWQPMTGNSLGQDHLRFHQILLFEKDLFQLRVKDRQEEERIYKSRAEQLRLSSVGSKEQNKQLSHQRSLIEQEITNVEILIAENLARLPRLLALKRQYHEINEKQAFNKAKIAEALEQIGDYELRRLNSMTKRREEISKELSDIEEKRSGVVETLAAARDVMARTGITAPITGVVANIQITTKGGVLAPGAPILDIVPDDEPMIIKARVAPTDIDHVRAGQTATVHLSAYSHRYAEKMPAFVETVSADLQQDPTTGQSFYLARVRVETKELEALPADIKLTPGMPTEVFITTDVRTVISYLMQPLSESINRAFKEP